MATTTTTLIAVGEQTLLCAEEQIRSCQSCSPLAGLPFSWVLDQVTKRNPAVTDYLLAQPAHCIRCGGEVFEKTLVEW